MANTKINDDMIARMNASFPEFMMQMHDLYFNFPQQFPNLPENPKVDQVIKELSTLKVEGDYQSVGHKRVIFHR